MPADGGQVTIEYAIVCRLRYPSLLRRHKYCMRPPLLMPSQMMKAASGTALENCQRDPQKQEQRTCLTGNGLKKFICGYLEYLSVEQSLDLLNNAVILTHLSGLHCCCAVLRIVAYFTTFLWLSLWKGWFYRSQCWWRSWISCDVTHYDGRSLW